MKRVGMVVLVLMMLGLWQAATPRGAYACSCAPPPEPRVALESATSVFSGMAVDVKEESSPGITRRAVTFDVISSWKGASQAQLVVYTAMDSAMCGVDFEVGKRYLVYTSGDEANPNTGLCDRTKLLTVSGEDIAKLGPGKQPVANPAVQPTAQSITQPTAQATAPNEVQASFIPYVIPALAVVVILMVLSLVIFRRKSA